MLHKYNMALGIYAGGQMADFSSISRAANVMTVQAVCQKNSMISVYINKCRTFL